MKSLTEINERLNNSTVSSIDTLLGKKTENELKNILNKVVKELSDEDLDTVDIEKYISQIINNSIK